MLSNEVFQILNKIFSAKSGLNKKGDGSLYINTYRLFLFLFGQLSEDYKNYTNSLVKCTLVIS
jgi:hypothetical protein